MSATKTQSHEYTIGEVLRRGVPIHLEASLEVTRPVSDDPIEKLTYLYRVWLDSAATNVEIARSFDDFFRFSEAVINHPAHYQRLLEHNTAHTMTAVMGGDLEVALMDLFVSWDLPQHHRNKIPLMDDARGRFNREGKRVAKLERLSNDVTESDTSYVTHRSAPTLIDYSTSAVAESIALAMEFINHRNLGELLESKTKAPARGIKNIGEKIIYLAHTTYQGYEALCDSDDQDEQDALKGVILRAEALMILWLACKNGKLKDAWPITASQRLHYGHYRHPDDKITTDLVCIFPSANFAVPIRVHSAQESLKGEASEIVVFHRTNLYTSGLDDCELGRQLGAVTFGLLGLPGGASRDYLDTRATFLASKVNDFASRIGASGKPWYSNTATRPTPVLNF